jgi:hypothetical protein
MRSTIALAVAGLVSLGLAGGASAEARYAYYPHGPVSATGDFNLTINGSTANCTASWTGHVTTSGMIMLNGVSITGAGLCGSITAVGLPWKVMPDKGNQMMFHTMQFSVTGQGPCGPGLLKYITASNNGQYAIPSPSRMLGACRLSGNIVTNPVIKIQPQ